MTFAWKSLDLSIDEAGAILAEAVRAMGTLEAACIHEQEDAAPLPRGLLTCGEACRMAGALVALIPERYPQLLEPGVLEETLTVSGGGFLGEPN